MKKNLIVKQDGYKECGAASLLSIIRYYGGNISINKLVKLTHTDKLGTNFYNIKVAANTLGLEALGYKVNDITKLHTLKKPFLCQIIEKNYEHFIVVYKVNNKKLEIMDPRIGKRIISTNEFLQIWTNYIMLFNPRKKLTYYKEKKYLNKIIIEVIKKNKGIVFNILLLSIIFMVLSFLYTYYIQIILSISDYNNLLITTFVFSLILLIKCITSFFRNQILIYLNQKIDCSTMLNTFKKLLLLPLNYYKNRTTGEIITRINDLIYVKNILNKLILTVFLDLILFVFSIIILFSINKIMFLILILICLIYMINYLIFKEFLKEYININQENSSLINSFLIESISGFETIKNLKLENIFEERMEDIYVKALNDNYAYNNICNLEYFLNELVSLIGILLIEFLGFKFVIDGTFSLGNLLTFIFLTNYFIEPIKNFLSLSQEYFYAKNAIVRLNNLFEMDEENFIDLTNYNVEGNITLKNLNFSYNGEVNILNNINLNIEKGSKVLILGKSGSGKSTILKLLLKYYDIKRDTLFIDNIDICDYSISNLRNNIALISQHEFLFTDTIKNNITMYTSIDDKKFAEICSLVCLDEFVGNLFLGYDTVLEENGINLSGGQRQRIILARLLLQNKKILLIDEGLNALDINLEQKILKNIFSKFKDKTIIVVSHRIENSQFFNQIIKIKDGYIIDNITEENSEVYL